MRAAQSALLSGVLLACVEPQTTSLPAVPGESWLLASFEGEILSHLFVAQEVSLTARGWSRPEDQTLALIPLPWSLEALQLEPGPVPIPAVDAPARGLPPETPVYLVQGEGTTEPEDARPWRTGIRLPRYRPIDCAALDGCLAADWPYCQLDCPAVTVAPPAPPEAANLPTIRTPDCGAGATGLLSGRCVEFLEVCPEDWPPELRGQANVVFADATAAGPGDGTEGTPFVELTTAIAAVPDGGTVALRGTFDGNVVIRDRRLTLRGVCPSRSRLATRTGTTVVLWGGEVALRGLSVVGPQAMRIDGGQHQGRRLYLEAEVGVQIERGAVETSTVWLKSTGTGVLVRGGTWQGRDLELEIQGGDGVQVNQEASAQLEGVRIVAPSGARTALFVTGALELSGAIIEGLFLESARVEQGGQLSLSNTRLLASGSHGLIAQGGSALELDTVEIAQASERGLQVTNSALRGMDLWVHDIHGSAAGFGQAIVLDHDQAQQLERVRIEDVVEGILIDPPAKPETGPVTLRDVEISDCETYGMTLQGGLDQPVEFFVERARVRRLGLDGVRLRRFSVPVVTDLHVEDAGVEGIDISGDYGAQISRAKVQRAGAACYKANLSQTFQIDAQRQRIEDLDLSEPGRAGGTAIGLYLVRGSFTFRRVRVERSALGVLAQGTFDTRFEGAEIRDNGVGMDLSTVADDLPLLTGVHFEGNDTDLLE